MIVQPIDPNAIAVIESDRIYALESGLPLSQWSRNAIANGEWDHHFLVQAFARRRIETSISYRLRSRFAALWAWVRS